MPDRILINKIKKHENLFQFISSNKQTNSTISVPIIDSHLYKIESRENELRNKFIILFIYTRKENIY